MRCVLQEFSVLSCVLWSMPILLLKENHSQLVILWASVSCFRIDVSGITVHAEPEECYICIIFAVHFQCCMLLQSPTYATIHGLALSNRRKGSWGHFQHSTTVNNSSANAPVPLCGGQVPLLLLKAQQAVEVINKVIIFLELRHPHELCMNIWIVLYLCQHLIFSILCTLALLQSTFLNVSFFLFAIWISSFHPFGVEISYPLFC